MEKCNAIIGAIEKLIWSHPLPPTHIDLCNNTHDARDSNIGVNI